MSWFIVTGVFADKDSGQVRPGSRPVWGPYATQQEAKSRALAVPGTFIVEAADERGAQSAAFKQAGLPEPADAVGQA